MVSVVVSFIFVYEVVSAEAVLKIVGFGFQGCFRQNVTVVTIYSSLGEDALIHSLNEVGGKITAFLFFMSLFNHEHVGDLYYKNYTVYL